MRLLAQILTEITQSRRQKVVAGVDFQWARNSYTYNAFRIFELIFWRRAGIRHETTVKKIDGITFTFAHSWESLLAISEQKLRETFSFHWKPIRIYIPMLLTPQGIPIPTSPYLFAIAFDNSAQNSGAITNISTPYTVTGSNPFLVLAGMANKLGGDSWPTNATYAGVNMTKLESALTTCNSNQWNAFYYLFAPATGSNTIALTWVGTPVVENVFWSSYSGTHQSALDSSATLGSVAGTATSFNATTNVVATNCWLITNTDNDQTAPTITGGTARQTIGSNQISDSNTTVGTGSQSIGFSWTPAAHWYYQVISISPPASAVTTTVISTLLFMGTG